MTPTTEPTSAPTAAPSDWSFFSAGIMSDADKQTVAAVGGGLSALAIVGIVIAAIAAVVLLILLLTGAGTGIMIWKKTAMKLDSHASNFEGELVEWNGVPMGVEVEAPVD